jgi:hypothetical protein
LIANVPPFLLSVGTQYILKGLTASESLRLMQKRFLRVSMKKPKRPRDVNQLAKAVISEAIAASTPREKSKEGYLTKPSTKSKSAK